MWSIRISALIIVLLAGLSTFAQENSPYSRFGVGNLQPQHFVQSKGMGGLSASLFDPNILNYANPASYAWLNRTSLDLGLYGNFLRVENATDQVNSGNASLSHLALGLPIMRNRMGLSLGMLPYTRVQYNIEEEVINDSITGAERYSYEGNGSFNQLFIGLGYRYKGFAIGANFAYLFGTEEDIKLVSFLDQPGSYDTRAARALRVSDFLWNFGLGYRLDFANDLKLNIGATGQIGMDANVTRDEEWLNVVITGEESYLVKDSILFIEQGKSTINLPPTFSGGISLHQAFRSVDDPQLRFGVDFVYTIWENFTGERAGNYANNWRIKAGGEFTPAFNETKSRIRRPVEFRAGFYYGSSPLVFDNEQLTEIGMTFGFGIPLSAKNRQHSNSKLNLSFEFGRRGSPELIRENYLRTTVGFSLTDAFWFIKSKID
jgi:hypothetical protein